MITKKLVFDHRGRTRADAEGPIELRCIVGRKPYYINTGVKVLSSQFEDGRVVRHRDARLLNERLEHLSLRIEEEINACIQAGSPIVVADIRRNIYNMDAHERAGAGAMLEWLTAQVPELPIAAGTRRRYDVLIGRLREFGGLLAWSDLTTENIYRFDRWLHRRPKPVSNGDVQSGREVQYIGDAAVYNYHRTLRSLLSRAVKMGVLDANPYDRLRGEFKRGAKENVEYLTDEEVRAIESLQPMAGTQMAMARDLFVFQLYTGLSYADTQEFDFAAYRKVGGVWTHRGERVKTGVAYVSDLMPQAVEVLEKYGWQAPKINNAQYNESLKTIQHALGIRTRLHSHLGRHTFATRALAAGAKMENVSKMLGHTNITQTQRYAKVLAESVHDDFALLREKLGK